MKSLLFITSVFLGLNFSGCGSEATGPERVIVTGSVTFDGKPVSQGEIWFIPTAGREAPRPVQLSKRDNTGSKIREAYPSVPAR